MKEIYKDKYIKLGLKISYYRKIRGLTQEKLVETIEKAASYIDQIEVSNVYKAVLLDTLFDIAAALDIPSNKFLDFDTQLVFHS